MAEMAATFGARFSENENMSAIFTDGDAMSARFGETQRVATSNYEELYNKPQINGHTLIGNKVSEELDLQGKMAVLSTTEIEKILYLG